MQHSMSGLDTYDQAAVMADQPRYAMDSKLYVKFYTRPVMHGFKSNEAGRPIYEDKEYIQILVPGDSKTTVDCPVTAEFRARFPNQYAKFKANESQSVTGTPLEMWPQVTRAMVAELKAQNITTVEQLAEMADTTAQNIMGNHDLRRRAKNFIEASKGEAVNNKLTEELNKRDDEINLLKTQMAQLVAAMQSKGKKE